MNIGERGDLSKQNGYNQCIHIEPRVFMLVDKENEDLKVIANSPENNEIINMLSDCKRVSDVGYECVFVSSELMETIKNKIK